MHVTPLCVELICCSVCGHVGFPQCVIMLKWVLSWISSISVHRHFIWVLFDSEVDVCAAHCGPCPWQTHWCWSCYVIVQWEYVNESVAALSLCVPCLHTHIFRCWSRATSHILKKSAGMTGTENLGFHPASHTHCQACLDAQQSGEKCRGRKCSSYFYTGINISFTKADTIL